MNIKLILPIIFLLGISNETLATGIRKPDASLSSECSQFRTSRLPKNDDILYLKCVDQFYDDKNLVKYNKPLLTSDLIDTLSHDFGQSTTRLTMLNLVIGYRNFLRVNQSNVWNISKYKEIHQSLVESYKFKTRIIDTEVKDGLSNLPEEVVFVITDSEKDLDEKITLELKEIRTLLYKKNG